MRNSDLCKFFSDRPIAFITIGDKALIGIIDKGGEWWKVIMITDFINNPLMNDRHVLPRMSGMYGVLQGDSFGITTKGQIIPRAICNAKLYTFRYSIEHLSICKKYVFKEVIDPGMMTEDVAIQIVSRFLYLHDCKKFGIKFNLA